MPALCLSTELYTAYTACLQLHELVLAGTLDRSSAGVTRWIQEATGTARRARQNMISMVTTFLHQANLEEAETVLERHYQASLTHPAPRAALMVARAIAAEAAIRWEPTCPGDDLVLGWLAAVLVGPVAAAES